MIIILNTKLLVTPTSCIYREHMKNGTTPEILMCENSSTNGCPKIWRQPISFKIRKEQ